eukprot:5130032-Lingulodinium_polyedra.AAC.1
MPLGNDLRNVPYKTCLFPRCGGEEKWNRTSLLGKRRFHFASPQNPFEVLGVKKNENDFGSDIVFYMPTR